MSENLANGFRRSSRVKREIKTEVYSESKISKVANKTKTQELKLNSVNPDPWSEEELSALLEALNKFNWGEWEEMAAIIKTRSIEQIHSKLSTYSNQNPTENSSQLLIDLHNVAKKLFEEHSLRRNDATNELNVKDVPESQVENTQNNDEVAQGNGKIVALFPYARWTEAEHAALLKGLENHKWGEWEEISKYVNSRTSNQVQKRLYTRNNSIPPELMALVEKRKSEHKNGDSSKKNVKTVSNTIKSVSSTLSSRKSSIESIKNLIEDNFEDEIKPVQDEISSPTPIGDNVVMDEGVADSVTMDTSKIEKGMTKENNSEMKIIDSSEQITDVSENLEDAKGAVNTKRARKLSVSVPSSPKLAKSKPPSKPPVVTNSHIPAKKRTYTRKNIRTVATAVDLGEEVSILSSSSSSEFERESINIMSSSSSSSSGNVSNASFPSVLSEKASVKSKESSTSSTISNLSSVSSVQDWEKAACPAIFMKENLINSEVRFQSLKIRIKSILSKNPQITQEELWKSLKKGYSFASIIQVLLILRPSISIGSIEQTQNIPEPKKKGTVASASIEGEEEQISDNYELLKKLSMTSSGRKRKIRSEEGYWIDPNEIEGRVISHDVTPLKEKRKRKYIRKQLDGYGEEDLSTTEDPFRLILLNDYHSSHDDHESAEVYEIAPFTVEMCSSVILLMDLHAHLHSSEIIGLLGGTFIKTDADIPILRIDYGYPCLTAHSTGTQVDVDPLSEMEAGEFFESKNVRMTGWYHSHPNFEPNPSLRDLETQTMYQGLFRNTLSDSDIEPFVGVIVNPYLAITESSSHVECFYVAPSPDPTHERLPYRLPIRQKALSPEIFPVLLEKMRETIFRAQGSPDRLDMQKNAEPGVKRIEKLYKSLQFHGELTPEQMEQIKELFK